jgi:DNA anti-recombination protein RmuC
MSDGNFERRDNSQLMRTLGELTGAVREMHQGLSTRMEDIKEDIRRLESGHNDRMNRIEANMGQRIADLQTSINNQLSGLGTRVTNLEAEDKRLIEKTAKLSALGGGIGGALAAGAVELLKRM